MGRASAVLTPRVAAGLALLGVLLAYYLCFRLLPNLPTSADVLFVAFVLIPAVFALVWIALPLRRSNRLLWIAIGLYLVFLSIIVFVARPDSKHEYEMTREGRTPDPNYRPRGNPAV